MRAFWSNLRDRRPRPPQPKQIRVEPKLVEKPKALDFAGANMLLGSKQIQANYRAAIKLARPFPGVIPADRKDLVLANDSNIAAAYDFAGYFGIGSGVMWPGYTYLAELAQRPEYRRISETIAKEMTRKWIRFHTAGEGDKQNKIDGIGEVLDRLKARDVFRQAIEQDGFFGRSSIYLDLGVAEDDRAELATPLILHPNKIPIGSLRHIRTIEPMWTYPGTYNSTSPTRMDFYRPTSWWVMNREIHSSRLLNFVGREMPDLLKPAFMFGGLSMSQMVKPYVDNWLRTRQSVSDLIHSFSVSGLKTNLTSLLASGVGDGTGLLSRMEGFNRARDNRGMFVIDKDTEEFFNVTTPLSSLDKLQAQAQEHIASIAGIPLTVLLGITPSGLNASSEGEIRTFYAWIEAQQNDIVRDPLKRLIDIIQLNLFGGIDEDITFDFVPLWTLDESAIASIKKTNADTAAVLIGQGVIAPEEERERLASEDNGNYNNIDLSDPMPTPPGQEEGGEEGLDDSDEAPPGGAPKPPAPPKPPTVGQGNDAEGEWQEDDHKRDKGGKFSSTGGGSGGSSHPAPHPLSKQQVEMHKIASGSGSLAEKIENVKHLHSQATEGGATHKYGAKLLKSLESGPALPSPHPLSKQQVQMHEIATGKAENKAAKIKEIFSYASTGGATEKYGKKLLAALGGQVEAPTAEPKAEEPKAEEPKAEEPKAEEPKAEEPKSDLPQPYEGSALQKSLFAKITALGITKEQQEQILKEASDPGKYSTAHSGYVTSEYAKKLAKALGIGPEAPKEGPKTDLPQPYEGSALQKNLFMVVNTTGISKEQKKQILEDAADPDNVNTGPATKAYAMALAEAMGVVLEPGKTPEEAPKSTSTMVAGPKKDRISAISKTAKRLKGTGKYDDGISEEALSAVPTLDKQFWGKIDKDARRAVKNYTDSGYGAINSALRSPTFSDVDPKTVAQINHIDELFEHDAAVLTEDVVLRRGEDVPSEVIDQWEAGLKAGLPVRYTKTGFISASMASKAAFSGKNTQFEIVARKGTRALGADAISDHYENEILMRHGQAFEVFEIERRDVGTVVRMISLL